MYKLTGTHEYASGASGTVTLPEGAVLLQIVATGATGAKVSIFGGSDVPLPSTLSYVFRFLHRLFVAPSSNKTIVFTSTTSYFVEYIKAGNT